MANVEADLFPAKKVGGAKAVNGERIGHLYLQVRRTLTADETVILDEAVEKLRAKYPNKLIDCVKVSAAILRKNEPELYEAYEKIAEYFAGIEPEEAINDLIG